MIITYIDKNGNFAQLDNVFDKERMSKIEKIDNTRIEKRQEEEKKQEEKIAVKVKKEVTVQKKEVSEDKAEPSDDLFDKAKQYCKEQKIRWYWLLKWDNLIKKAVEHGFTY